MCFLFGYVSKTEFHNLSSPFILMIFYLEVRILILRSSYEDLIKQGNRFPFRPGMTASVEIVTNRKSNVLSVPLAAVTTRNPNAKSEEEEKAKKREEGDNPRVTSDKKVEKKADKIVLFVNEKGVAKMVEVKTGISDYDNIEILSGVADSAEVVTGPFLVVSKRLKEGDRIKLMEKKEPKKEDNDK